MIASCLHFFFFFLSFCRLSLSLLAGLCLLPSIRREGEAGCALPRRPASGGCFCAWRPSVRDEPCPHLAGGDAEMQGAPRPCAESVVGPGVENSCPFPPVGPRCLTVTVPSEPFELRCSARSSCVKARLGPPKSYLNLGWIHFSPLVVSRAQRSSFPASAELINYRPAKGSFCS